MNLALGVLLWLCSVAEVFLCYCFVDLTEGSDLVHKHKIRVGVSTGIIGSLSAYNRSLYGGLVSWIFFIFLSFMIFASVRTKVNNYKRTQCLGMILAYHIFSAHIQLLSAFLMMAVFQNIEYERLYWEFGIYKVGCCAVAFLTFCAVYLLFSWYIRRNRWNLKGIRKSIYLVDLIAFYSMILVQSQLEDYGYHRTLNKLGILSTFMIFMFLLIPVCLKNAEILTDVRLLDVRNRLLIANYREIRKDYRNFTHTSHDMRNHLLLLQHYCDEGELDKIRDHLDEMVGHLSMEKEYILSGNDVTDMILNYKLAIAEREGTEIKVKSDPLNDLHIEESDWCIILSNLLDNAIEACRNIAQGDRWIHIRIRTQGEMLMIQISNTFSEDTDSTGEHSVESKQSGSVHGYGKKSVREKVKKYDGSVDWYQEGNVYTVSIVFYNKTHSN